MINPFVQDKPVEFVEVDKSIQANLSVPDRVHKGMNIPLIIPDSYHIDSDNKISLFNIPGLLDQLIALTDSAKKILLYIIFKLRNGKDTISLDQRTVCSYLSINTPSTYYTAIKQLTDAELIARKNNKEYFINPHFLFAGNRYRGMSNLYSNQYVHVRKFNLSTGSILRSVENDLVFNFGYEDDEDIDVNSPDV